MFEGLKDKLSSFKGDVEEQADEPDSEADAAEPETADAEAAAEPEASSTDTDTGEPDSVTEPEPDSDPETDAEDDPGLAKKAALAATGRTIITEEELEEPLEQLELELLQGDVEMSVAQEITDRIREELVGETRKQVESGEQVVERAIAEALRDVISVGQFDFESRIADAEKPVTIVFTGVNGVGKTTSIAKLARWFEERGHSSVLANGDTYRAGANEQIEEHADALDKKIITHEQGGDPAAVIYDAVEYAEANDVDVVLGDTAGRLHTADDLMAQLEKIDRVVDPDLTLFVDEAVAGQDATNRAKEFNDAAEIDGAILTKADADSQGGAAISIAHVTGKPILFLGTGQGYDDIERFDPDEIVSRLLEA
ncbi:signal recognition particle receptor FtsY [Natronomonas pharaonis DSM 2160]|uniref:Signal recognition particle receptor FtsY n=1 Tax=Natronomonas pharaonis (strain ATCC 35678 / DSM 2160 / CIP 103997 / JCM 8858 / NBRC 14720 / NCIMB 2260 / Gabara) TaxID=348780 RepID=A0A1U7ETF6_NATPD|nr:signal recognition particle-docking protein FtsY [Natronomonas pharaonis]CAI48182.1 signal recognition particle receptor FtsY [Natronomonas pharaonis DSM 2160]